MKIKIKKIQKVLKKRAELIYGESQELYVKLNEVILDFENNNATILGTYGSKTGENPFDVNFNMSCTVKDVKNIKLLDGMFMQLINNLE